MATVLLIGTLDTKGPETCYLRDRVRELGATTLVMDSGILGEAADCEADFTRQQVALAAGSTIEALRYAGTRGKAVEEMLKGVRTLTLELFEMGKSHPPSEADSGFVHKRARQSLRNGEAAGRSLGSGHVSVFDAPTTYSAAT